MIGTKAQCITYLANIKNENKMYEVKEHKKKRSLNANGYYWTLLNKISLKTGESKARVHNMNLRHLALIDVVLGGVPKVSIPDTDEAENMVLEAETYHVIPTGEVRGNRRIYAVLRGSHTFSTLEFSRLLDLAIQDAEALGIETITPEEKNRMMELYGKSYEKKHNTTA